MKAQIEATAGIPTSEQRLFMEEEGIDSILLDDDKTLANYGIERIWQAAPDVENLVRTTRISLFEPLLTVHAINYSLPRFCAR